MKSRSLRYCRLTFVFLMGAAQVHCGSATNFNRIWGSAKDTEAMLTDAKVAYDRGQFDEAISLASKLVAQNPEHEDAAVLLGYAYVSKAGLDPYRVAACLLETNATQSSGSSRCQPVSDTNKASLADLDDVLSDLYAAAPTTPPPSSSSTSASDSDVLKRLQKGLLSLSSADYASLSASDYTGSSGLFLGENKVIVPVAVVNDEVRSRVTVLQYLNEAVKMVCAFVDDSATLKTDWDRYQVFGCSPTNYTRKSAAKAHYLWAISHLGEALVFTSVLLYAPTNTSQDNLQKAATTLQNQSTSNVSTVISQVEEFQTAVSKIFDTDSTSSMISKTLYDLNATSAALDAMVGLPESVKAQISRIIQGIKETGKTLTGVTAQSKALKTRLLDNVTTSVAKKIDDSIKSVVSGGQPVDPSKVVTAEEVSKLPAEKQAQVKNLCNSFDGLTKDSPAEKKSAVKPKACG